MGLWDGDLLTAVSRVHATADALGNPTRFHLTAGQAHDLDGADVLLKNTPADAVIADRAYDAGERLIEPLQRAGKQVVIPSIRPAKFSASTTGICIKRDT